MEQPPSHQGEDFEPKSPQSADDERIREILERANKTDEETQRLIVADQIVSRQHLNLRMFRLGRR